jgi:hypothetical protein
MKKVFKGHVVRRTATWLQEMKKKSSFTGHIVKEAMMKEVLVIMWLGKGDEEDSVSTWLGEEVFFFCHMVKKKGSVVVY